MRLSRNFEKALAYATRIPYIAHILGVTAIAMEYGATETEAIGALLRDAVEDCGGAKRLRGIERKFGKAVAKIVDGCTDTDQVPKAAMVGAGDRSVGVCALRPDGGGSQNRRRRK
jgi:(p)ppGpp synthase/HD superfamily hydrolase